jgi:hypothetical protein
MGRFEAGTQPGQIVGDTPSPKKSRTTWTGGVAQVVECVLCKCEALNLNPSPTKKKRKPIEGENFPGTITQGTHIL